MRTSQRGAPIRIGAAVGLGLEGPAVVAASAAGQGAAVVLESAVVLVSAAVEVRRVAAR